VNLKPVKFIAVLAVSYALLKAPGVVFGAPVPASLIAIYIFFILVSTLLAMTATDEGARSLFSPVVRLAADPAWRTPRLVVAVVLPVAAALITYSSLSAVPGLPSELRSIHPAPPAYLAAYGKRFDLGALDNPLRALEGEDPAGFEGTVEAGRDVYFARCVYCHGARLDGRGHFARAIHPAPLPFTGSDTIAQLRESYLFWRIVRGGEGLPREAAPWSSAMPAFEATLTEEEVWQVITFLYDFTGNRPRRWE